MLEKFFVVSDVRHRLYLAAKPSHVGVDMDGLVYPPPPPHHPTTCSHQTRGHSLLPGAVLSCRYSGQWCLSGGCEALGLGYWWRVDYVDTCTTKSYMG
jgi:hypothetical protein